MSAFPPVEVLLRHRPPNLLISEVLAYDAASVTARANVLPGKWYSNPDGSMPAWIGIELMAQAIAAFVGLEGRDAGRPPKLGYLLGTREYMATVTSFPPHQPVEIRSRLVFRDASGLGAFDCALRIGDAIVAEATLKVYEEPESV